jgi:cell division protein ZapA
LKKHLKENKISEDIIEGILELDNEINNLLNKEDCLSYDIKINKLIINNFRSFGDNVILDLNDKDGIYQILGSNASGKSTILYFIMYMLYGKTPSTSKKEKFNDNKFINNRRDLDFCEGELFLQINSESYLIKKKTERKWNRNNTELSSCSTIVEYFKLDENGSILNDENEERKTSMQKTIEQSIGSYEDFIRKVFTDSDSLNYLLSNDKADFIDNILYDIGLDIFDKKLEAYKSYKKNNYKKEERVVIDLEKTQTTISEYENNIEIHKNDIKDYKNTLSNINSDINVFLSKKDEELKNIITIDEKIKSFDLNKSENSITILKKDKNDKESSLILLENEISSLNNKYKDNELEDLKKELDNLKNILSEKKDNINKTKLNILEKTNFKNNLENNISILENEIVNLRTNYEKELSNIDKEIENTEKSILELEHSKECPTCKRVYDSQEVIITIEENIKKKKESIDNLLNSKKIENNPELKNIKDKAASNKSKIEDIKKEILSLESVISELNILKSEDEKFLLSKKDSFEILNNNISNIEKDLSHKEKLVSQKNNIPLLLENIELKILNENRLIEEYKKNIKNIEKNEITKNNIKVIEENLKEILVKKDNINSKINHIENVLISELSNKIKTLLEKIDLWKIQEKKDLINKLYLDSIHRDGLPTILLRKLLPNINNELKSLLSEMNFTLWFDENINLKMTNNSFNISQNVLDGSGMERTFIAFVLKLTLMKISNKSKFNLLLFDEVSSKLDTNNVEYFKELLHKTKSYIDKIMVIDHYNDFIPDFIIEVKPDENGISHLQISE